MGIPELILISVGLSMDAFAVSVCIGMERRQFSVQTALTAGLWFGAAQAAMPFAGWLIGGGFAGKIEGFDHWIVFALLAFIGGKMLVESRPSANDDSDTDLSKIAPNEAPPGFSKMLPLAVATSVDALAVGVSFAFLEVDIVPAVCVIGIITFAFSAIGVRIGAAVGARLRLWATRAGGIILIAIGVKTLLEHMGAVG